MASIAILWVVCGIASGMIAQSKQRNFGSFFVLGLVLGIVGVICALAAQSAEAQRLALENPNCVPTSGARVGYTSMVLVGVLLVVGIAGYLMVNNSS
jgi:hypothetical protein